MATLVTVGTFDPKKVVLTLGGIIASGYADGTFITIERSGEGFEKKHGADGSVERINKNSFDYNVTLTLIQSSPINDALSALFTIDQNTNTGVVPLTIKDLSGTTAFFAAQAWIAKDPNYEAGDSLSTREWTIHTGVGTLFTGGNIL